MQTENNVAAQAGDEPMRDAFEAHIRSRNPKELFVARWPDGSYKHHGTDGMWAGWQAAMASQVSPRATADVERDELMMQCLFSIASGHTYTDKQEILHCSICNADLDDGDEHSATCLTVRAGEYIATTKPGA